MKLSELLSTLSKVAAEAAATAARASTKQAMAFWNRNKDGTLSPKTETLKISGQKIEVPTAVLTNPSALGVKRVDYRFRGRVQLRSDSVRLTSRGPKFEVRVHLADKGAPEGLELLREHYNGQLSRLLNITPDPIPLIDGVGTDAPAN